MAHQAHALHWNVLADNLQYKTYYHPHDMEHRQDILPLEKPGQAKEFLHFGRKFASQIHDFAVSERAKYEPQEHYAKRAATWLCSDMLEPEDSLPGTASAGAASAGAAQVPDKKKKPGFPSVEKRMVYSNELKARYWVHRDDDEGLDFGLFPYSEGESQDIKRWLEEPFYSSIGLGDTIKILMMEASAVAPALSAHDVQGAGLERKRENMETLLLMANHPQISIQAYRNMSHGHHFGVSRVAEEAVKAYVYLNLLVVLKERGSEAFANDASTTDGVVRQKYMASRSYARLIDSVAGSYDGDAQCIVHQDFFFSQPWSSEARKSHRESSKWLPAKDVLADMEELREYLKGVWRIMVTYDMILREEGQDPEWETEFENAVGQMFGDFW